MQPFIDCLKHVGRTHAELLSVLSNEALFCVVEVVVLGPLIPGEAARGCGDPRSFG
jgi:hypothetical protein